MSDLPPQGRRRCSHSRAPGTLRSTNKQLTIDDLTTGADLGDVPKSWVHYIRYVREARRTVHCLHCPRLWLSPADTLVLALHISLCCFLRLPIGIHIGMIIPN